jgi:hypothetical protein
MLQSVPKQDDPKRQKGKKKYQKNQWPATPQLMMVMVS